MKNIKENLIFVLLLVPTATELLENGHFPTLPREIITDLVMTLVVLLLILVTRRRKKTVQKLQKEILRSKEFDTLTGLPMRTRFDENLNVAIQNAKNKQFDLHLTCIDIDHFKNVNENYGSAMGDEILKKLIQRIKSIVPSNSGQLYRLGGDTFALLFSEEAAKDVHAMISSIVTINASGNKLLKSYQSHVNVGTAKLNHNMTGYDLWRQAVNNMRKNRQT